MSGEQKGCISLARVLYAFDDLRAAVVPKVAKQIFGQCIGPLSLFRGKTRPLVTHETHFSVERDQMILMTNGRIEDLQIEQQPVIESFNDT